MIRHVLMFKFKENCEKKSKIFLDEFDALEKEIDEIYHQEIHYNTNKHRDYDVLCIVDFQTQSDYDKYDDDERHKVVARKSKPIIEKIACVDYSE